MLHAEKYGANSTVALEKGCEGALKVLDFSPKTVAKVLCFWLTVTVRCVSKSGTLLLAQEECSLEAGEQGSLCNHQCAPSPSWQHAALCGPLVIQIAEAYRARDCALNSNF